MSIARDIETGVMTYADLPEGVCRRFRAVSGDRTGYGLVHPDGSAIIQWGNIASQSGETATFFDSETDWRPFFKQWDARVHGDAF